MRRARRPVKNRVQHHKLCARVSRVKSLLRNAFRARMGRAQNIRNPNACTRCKYAPDCLTGERPMRLLRCVKCNRYFVQWDSGRVGAGARRCPHLYTSRNEARLGFDGSWITTRDEDSPNTPFRCGSCRTR